MSFTRVKVNRNDIEDEKRILTALITDKVFHETDSIEYDFFSVDYMNIIASWSKDFYGKYNKAPGRHIQDYYEKTEHERGDADNDLMEIFFESIAEEYSRTEKRNTGYISDLKRNLQTKKELELGLIQAGAYLKEGKFDEIYNIFNNQITFESNQTETFDPMQETEVEKYFALKKNLSIMDLEGDLKRFFRYFERGWVVSFLAPEKGGKSFLLEEMNFIAQKNGLTTAVFSIELNEMHYKKRKYERITTKSDSYEGMQELPFIDCIDNQTNKCAKPKRKCNVPLGFDSEDKVIRKDSQYRPCLVCKGTGNFKATTVLAEVKVESMGKRDVIDGLNAFNSMHHGKTFVTCYPTFSASIKDIAAKINYLENTHGAVFDAIFIDYPDITVSDKIGREVYDEIWKTVKRIADEKNVCVFVVEQGNKDANFKDNIDQTNASEDKRKNAHVDAKYAINMTKQEAERKTARLSCILHRHMDFKSSTQLLCCRHHVFANPFGETAIINTNVK